MKRTIAIVLALLLTITLFGGCQNEVTFLKVTTKPTKLDYNEGDDFDPAGMVVSLEYTDGSLETITDYEIKGGKELKKTDTYVEIIYGKFKATVKFTVSSAGNKPEYRLENIKEIENSPLNGKTIYYLGSSITLGQAAENTSFADYIAKRTGGKAVKEAVGGTKLADVADNSYVKRMAKLPTNEKVDIFVCQLSTNDANLSTPGTQGAYGENPEMGVISDSFNKDDFVKNTVCGAIEYIIATAKETWNCPIVFYSSPKYNNPKYEELVANMDEIAKKWGITFLNLFDDEEFSTITDNERALYMADDIHPTMAGYLEWWTPKFEETLVELVK